MFDGYDIVSKIKTEYDVVKLHVQYSINMFVGESENGAGQLEFRTEKALNDDYFIYSCFFHNNGRTFVCYEVNSRYNNIKPMNPSIDFDLYLNDIDYRFQVNTVSSLAAIEDECRIYYQTILSQTQNVYYNFFRMLRASSNLFDHSDMFNLFNVIDNFNEYNNG